MCLKYKSYTIRGLLEEPMIVIQYMYKMATWEEVYNFKIQELFASAQLGIMTNSEKGNK